MDGTVSKPAKSPARKPRADSAKPKPSPSPKRDAASPEGGKKPTKKKKKKKKGLKSKSKTRKTVEPVQPQIQQIKIEGIESEATRTFVMQQTTMISDLQAQLMERNRVIAALEARLLNFNENQSVRVERITSSGNKKQGEQKLNINLNLKDERHNFTSIETRGGQNGGNGTNGGGTSGNSNMNSGRGHGRGESNGEGNYSSNMTPRRPGEPLSVSQLNGATAAGGRSYFGSGRPNNEGGIIPEQDDIMEETDLMDEDGGVQMFENQDMDGTNNTQQRRANRQGGSAAGPNGERPTGLAVGRSAFNRQKRKIGEDGVEVYFLDPEEQKRRREAQKNGDEQAPSGRRQNRRGPNAGVEDVDGEYDEEGEYGEEDMNDITHETILTQVTANGTVIPRTRQPVVNKKKPPTGSSRKPRGGHRPQGSRSMGNEMGDDYGAEGEDEEGEEDEEDEDEYDEEEGDMDDVSGNNVPQSQRLSQQQKDRASAGGASRAANGQSKNQTSGSVQMQLDSASKRGAGVKTNDPGQKNRVNQQRDGGFDSVRTSTLEQDEAGILESNIEDVGKLKDMVGKLQQLNHELKRKVIKYKRQIEVIPELKAELQDMRSTVELVQKNVGMAIAGGNQEGASVRLSSSHNLTSGNNVIFDADGQIIQIPPYTSLNKNVNDHQRRLSQQKEPSSKSNAQSKLVPRSNQSMNGQLQQNSSRNPLEGGARRLASNLTPGNEAQFDLQNQSGEQDQIMEKMRSEGNRGNLNNASHGRSQVHFASGNDSHFQNPNGVSRQETRRSGAALSTHEQTQPRLVGGQQQLNHQSEGSGRGRNSSKQQNISNKEVVRPQSGTIDYTFGGKAILNGDPQLESIKRQIDVKDEKNFAIMKENVDLKSLISELKEQVIKKAHIIEDLNSEIKIMINDMRYMHQKLNKGTGLGPEQISAKSLVSMIDNLIDERQTGNKETSEQVAVLQERIVGLKDQVSNLQSLIDRNQEVIVQQSQKLSTYEDLNKNLRSQVSAREDSDKLLDHFKQHVRNHLLNIRAQVDAIQTDYSPGGALSPGKKSLLTERLHELSIDQLFDQVADKAATSCINEKNLRSIVQQLEGELAQRQREHANIIREFDDRRVAQMRQEEEHKYKLQDQILRLEDQLERTKYDKTFNQQDSDARVRQKELQLIEMKDEVEVMETFLCETFKRFQVLNFQKVYAEQQARVSNGNLARIEAEVKRYLPVRDTLKRFNPIKAFRRSVRAVIFANRIRKVSIIKSGDYPLKRQAVLRLLDNWLNGRQYWDSSIRQNPRIFAIVDHLNMKLQKQQQPLAALPSRYLSDERLDYIDALKVRIAELDSQNHAYSYKLGELKGHVDVQDRRIRTFEQDQRMRSNERSSPLRNGVQSMPPTGFMGQGRYDGQQDELIIRLRGIIREMESKLEDQTHTYEQKIRYLKQEIEMKKLQIDNMKRLIDIRDSSNERNPLASSQPLKPGFSQTILASHQTRNSTQSQPGMFGQTFSEKRNYKPF